MMPSEFYTIIRWLHVVCASAWYGEIVVINFILIPTLSKYSGTDKKNLINDLFPKFFKLASVLAASTIITGAYLLYHLIGFDFSLLKNRGSWGWSIMIAGSLGLILAIFHFFVEQSLSKRYKIGNANLAENEIEDIHLKLKIVPRLGLLVITFIFILMMNSTHQLIGF